MTQETPAGASASADGASAPTVTFHELGIAPQILRCLDHFKLVQPTPIQREAIPAANVGTDITGIAQTGTGKTLAYGIPLIQYLMLQGGNALIMVPTRELAFQVSENLGIITRSLNMRQAVLIGGEPMYKQLRELKIAAPDIIIATPGRLNDILRRKKISLEQVKVVVLDEADRMLDMGFAPQIEEVMQHVPQERQTMLFSATMPPQIVRLAETYQKSPVRIEVAPAGTKAELVSQELVVVPRGTKPELLEQILRDYRRGPVLIFSRTKSGATTLTTTIRQLGYQAAELHSERTLDERRQALADFKSGHVRILVATDIAARGIDVSGISLVLNYDLPENPEDYVHRIGRTGRAGKDGHAISFATTDQGRDVKNIERLIRMSIPRSERTDAVLEDTFGPARGRGRGRGAGSFGGRREAEEAPTFTNISAPSGFTGPRSTRNRR
jgi:ATP-dependent RNA helicase RhlE